MIVKAAAKINLMLDVLGTLPDGYHSLFMVMQSVGCYDFVEVKRTNSEKIEILSVQMLNQTYLQCLLRNHVANGHLLHSSLQ